MKKEKAEDFNDFIHEALTCYNIFCSNDDNLIEIPQIEKNKYHESTFEFSFQNFIEELNENIRLYEDISVIRDYVIVCFPGMADLVPFHEDENKWTIERGYEVPFLLNLKKNIEKYINEIQACFSTSETTWFGTTLRHYYDKEIANMYKKDADEVSVSETIIEDSKKENRFVFDMLKAECDLLTRPIDIIKLIHDRLFDFEQWQLEYDPQVYDEDIGMYNEYTNMYYPNFEKLCAIELRRLEKQMEIEKRMPVQPAATITYRPAEQPYRWNATDTDFLELFAALYQNESIARKDGSSLSRKEMLEYFQGVLGLEIKDVEGKLNKAGNRNANTPFLDNLAQQFRNYVAGKEMKAARRR